MIDTLDTTTIDKQFIDTLLLRLPHKCEFTKYKALFISGISYKAYPHADLICDLISETWRINVYVEVEYKSNIVNEDVQCVELGRYDSVEDLISAVYLGIDEFYVKLKKNLEYKWGI